MTRYIFCVIAVLVQPLFVWYVYHKQDKREAALKIPMIGCQCALSCCADICVLQTVYKNSGENTVYFLIWFRL